MAHWGLVVDLRKCIGCKTCTAVCMEMNCNPSESWRQVIEHLHEKSTDLLRLFLPKSCMHCQNPPCHDVCPSGATYQRSDGIVDIKTELCIGCGYCVVACPYDARAISFQDKIKIRPRNSSLSTEAFGADRIGICTKCDFCLPRITEGLSKGLIPGSDVEATPLCVNYCIANALYFGDMDDPESTVSQLIRKNKTFCLLEELETRPSVCYIIE